METNKLECDKHSLGTKFMRLHEFKLPKNQWELLVSNNDKLEFGPDLVSLVQNAYSKTKLGSLVNSLKEVIPSDWKVIDWDDDPEVDSCVFYRKNRPGENWVGYKIQGIGHDGAKLSKEKAVNKVKELLNKPGVWIESSDAMRHILKKSEVEPITDETLLKKLFNDNSLTMIDKDTYRRKLSNQLEVTETVFGNPILKKNI